MNIYILEQTNYQTYFIMKTKNLKKPFFASFLENQLKDAKDVKGGVSGSGVTDKIKDVVTRPQLDMLQTMKYPSDGDEVVVTI